MFLSEKGEERVLSQRKIFRKLIFSQEQNISMTSHLLSSREIKSHYLHNFISHFFTTVIQTLEVTFCSNIKSINSLFQHNNTLIKDYTNLYA